jgi:hypothetical protein
VRLPSGLPTIAQAPVLGLGSKVIDLGHVRQNSRVEAPVEIINRGAGGAALTVLLASSCPWVQINPSSLTIPAGEKQSAMLELVPDGSISLGNFTASVTVNAPNAASVTQLTLTVTGRIIKDIAVIADPPQVDLGEVTIGNEPVTVPLQFSTNDEQHSAQINKVIIEAPDGLRHAVEVQSRGSNTYDLIIHSANREEGEFSLLIVAEDANPELRPVQMQVCGQFVNPPRLRVAEDLVITLAPLEDPQTARTPAVVRGSLQIPLANDGGQPLTVSLEAMPEWLKPTSPNLTIPPHSESEYRCDYNFTGLSAAVFEVPLVLVSNDNGYPGSRRSI